MRSLAYGAFEALAGWARDSVARLSDATDFFEDGALNLLILARLALGAAWEVWTEARAEANTPRA